MVARPHKPRASQSFADGDGVLIYPGEEKIHKEEDRGLPDPARRFNWRTSGIEEPETALPDFTAAMKEYFGVADTPGDEQSMRLKRKREAVE